VAPHREQGVLPEELQCDARRRRVFRDIRASPSLCRHRFACQPFTLLPNCFAPALIRAEKLVFFGNSLERFRGALDAIGWPAAVFDRQPADDLVWTTRGVFSKLRLVVDALAGRILVRHVSYPSVA
jgi:hypothetical protein